MTATRRFLLPDGRGPVCIGVNYELRKCKTPLKKSGVCKSTRSRKGDRNMVYLMLVVFLSYLRKRRTKLKIDLDL